MVSSRSKKKNHKEVSQAWAPRLDLAFHQGDLVNVLVALDEYSPFDEVPGIVLSDTPRTYSFVEVFYNNNKKHIHVERVERVSK